MKTFIEVQQKILSMPLTSPTRTVKAREVKYIPETLLQDEELEFVIQAWLKEANSNGMLICTNKRLIFLDKGIISGLKTKSYQLSQIGSLESNSNFFSTNFKIHSSGTAPVEVQCFDKNDAKTFIDYVNNKISNKSDTTTNSSKKSITDELQKLADLRDKGIISNDEFYSLKSKFIS